MIFWLQSLPLFLLIFLSGLSLVVGDLLAKFWSENRQMTYFVGAIVAYVFYGLFFIPTLTKEGLIVSALAVILINIIGFVLIGLIIFKETLSIYQTAGLVLGTVAIFLLER